MGQRFRYMICNGTATALLACANAVPAEPPGEARSRGNLSNGTRWSRNCWVKFTCAMHRDSPQACTERFAPQGCAGWSIHAYCRPTLYWVKLLPMRVVAPRLQLNLSEYLLPTGMENVRPARELDWRSALWTPSTVVWPPS